MLKQISNEVHHLVLRIIDNAKLPWRVGMN